MLHTVSPGGREARVLVGAVNQKELFMNKNITLLVLAVVLAAMALVFFTHSGDRAFRLAGNTTGASVNGSGDGQTLPSVVPHETDGAPRPVSVMAGSDTPAESPSSATAGGSGATGSPEGPGVESRKPDVPSRTPSLTPWEITSAPPSQPDAQEAPKPARTEKPAKVEKPAKPEKPARAEKPEKTEKPAAQASAKPDKTPQRDDAASGTAAHTMKSIGLHFEGSNIKLRIVADNAFSCNSFVLTGPDRLVVDLPGKWSDVKVPSIPSNSLVKSVRVGRQPSGPRLVLDLARAIKGHRVQRANNVVEVLLIQ
jgi:outer membrane biosynthesis protein TonB